MSDDAKALIDRTERLREKRQNWLNWWQEIACRVMPSSATFTVDGPEGVKRTERQFSGKPVTANEGFASIMDDLVTPRTQYWHGLEAQDENINDDQEVAQYFERLTKLLFALRYSPSANFASQRSQGYLSMGAFGNTCLFVDEQVGVGPLYKQIFMREVLWAQNAHGRIDTVHRDFKMSVTNAAQMFGGLAKLPERMRVAYEKNPYQEFPFLHCVAPNEERVPSRRDHRGMPYASYYVGVDDKVILQRAGYRGFPFAIGRYLLGPGETFARSPAMSSWGAILTLNEEKKTVLRSGQRAVDPPLLLTEDGPLDAFNMRSNALNYGALAGDGTALVQPLKTDANIPLGIELMEIEQQEIDDAFLVTVRNMLLNENIKTATQVYEVIQQKGAILAPMAGRMESEDLGPMIQREIEIASRQTANAWIFEEMPQKLRDAGGLYKIKFTSPLAKAMRTQEAAAVLRTFEAIGQAIQIDPSAAFVLDVPQAVREIAEISGVPAHLLRDEKTVQQMQADHVQQQQLSQAAQLAPNVSTAVLNAAKAEQLRSAA